MEAQTVQKVIRKAVFADVDILGTDDAGKVIYEETVSLPVGHRNPAGHAFVRHPKLLIPWLDADNASDDAPVQAKWYEMGMGTFLVLGKIRTVEEEIEVQVVTRQAEPEPEAPQLEKIGYTPVETQAEPHKPVKATKLPRLVWYLSFMVDLKLEKPKIWAVKLGICSHLPPNVLVAGPTYLQWEGQQFVFDRIDGVGRAVFLFHGLPGLRRTLRLFMKKP